MAEPPLPQELADELFEIAFRARNSAERDRQFAALMQRHPEHAERLRAALPSCQSTEPESVGPFHILGKLGEGGFGTVYKARQNDIERVVALKVMRADVDSRAVLARFELERQVLAAMNHDAVARFYEAGQADGRPWFSMEFVEGLPLTEYCDQVRLTIADRLRFVLQACDGIQHAHAKGIVHRDLKPSNVLVRSVGSHPVVKIIDFGIARAADRHLSHSMQTALGTFLGTPEYMAPEQCGGNPIHIDARTDVYALGVMLYELLAGRLPFPADQLPRHDLLAVQRLLNEQDPPPPCTSITALGDAAVELAARRQLSVSAWRRALRGDLDAIVGRAMEKDPARRYQSVADLAADLRRHLAHEPVVAQPPSTIYRLRKFARRYRSHLLAAAAIAVMLVSGVLVWLSAYQAAAREDLRRQRLDGEAHASLTRAETLLAQTGTDPSADARLWPQIVEHARLADRSARLGEGGTLTQRTGEFLAFVEATAATASASEALASQKKNFLDKLEVAFLSVTSPRNLVNDTQSDLLLPLLRASPLIGAGGQLPQEVASDASFVSAAGPLAHVLLCDAAMQCRNLRRARAALEQAGLLALLPGKQVAHQLDLAGELLARSRALAGSLLVEDAGLHDLEAQVLAWGDATGIPDTLNRRKPRSLVEAFVLANILYGDPVSQKRTLREFAVILENEPPSRFTGLSTARMYGNDTAAHLSFGTAATPDLAIALMWSTTLSGIDLARPALLELHRQSPTPQVCATLAMILALRGEFDFATEVTADVTPESCDALTAYSMSLVYQALNDPERALAWTEASVARCPLHPRGWCNIGWYRLRSRDFVRAVTARRIGHVIGSALDGWPYPSADWVHEAEVFADEADRIEHLLGAVEAISSDEDLMLAFRYSELTGQVDRALRLYDRMRTERPHLVDPLVNRHSIQAAGIAARAAQGASDPTERSRWDRRTYEILHEAIEKVWPAALEGRSPEAVQRFRFWTLDYVALMQFQCRLDRFPIAEATEWEDLWRRVRLMR